MFLDLDSFEKWTSELSIPAINYLRRSGLTSPGTFLKADASAFPRARRTELKYLQKKIKIQNEWSKCSGVLTVHKDNRQIPAFIFFHGKGEGKVIDIKLDFDTYLEYYDVIVLLKNSVFDLFKKQYNELPDESKDIIDRRSKRESLESIGASHNVSKEWIRIVEKKVRKDCAYTSKLACWACFDDNNKFLPDYSLPIFENKLGEYADCAWYIANGVSLLRINN